MILRTFMCGECGHRLEVELRSDQWQEPPPDCPMCAEQTQQVFKPPAIIGSHIAKATELAHTIAAEDYQVADLQSPSRSGRAVRYKDVGPEVIPPSTWTGGGNQMAQALALGRETRLKYGNGLDVLAANLKSGAQPDLIELSKKRSYRVY